MKSYGKKFNAYLNNFFQIMIWQWFSFFRLGNQIDVLTYIRRLEIHHFLSEYNFSVTIKTRLLQTLLLTKPQSFVLSIIKPWILYLFIDIFIEIVLRTLPSAHTWVTSTLKLKCLGKKHLFVVDLVGGPKQGRRGLYKKAGLAKVGGACL